MSEKIKNSVSKNVIFQFAQTMPVDLSSDFEPTEEPYSLGFGVYISEGGDLKYKALGDNEWRTITVPDNHYPNIAFKAIAANGTTANVQIAGV